MELTRFTALLKRLGAKLENYEAYFDEVLGRHREEHRRYHNENHVKECLDHLDRVKDQVKNADELEIAFWYHDAIYDTHAGDNELRSADWAARVLKEGGVGEDVQKRVHNLIMATKHGAKCEGDDVDWMADIDIGILGADDARYNEYSKQIREEFIWAPEELYRTERAKVLRMFLNMPRLYFTDFFTKERDAQARKNMARAIADLEAGKTY